jgi:polar amino acid transport system substrate-binding protein
MLARVIVLLTLLAFLVPGMPRPASAEKTIRLAAMNWKPYTAQDLPGSGFYAEIVTRALARGGYDVVVEFYPWKRALLLVREGRINGLIGAGYTPERAEFMAYPDYAWESDFHFFRMGGGDRTVKNFNELCPATLGQLRGTRVTRLVEKLVPCMDIDFTDSIKKNLDKLIYGRVDYVINTPETLRHLMGAYHPDKVGQLGRIDPPLEHVRIYTAFSKQMPGWEALALALTTGVEAMKATGEYEAILKRHGMR